MCAQLRDDIDAASCKSDFGISPRRVERPIWALLPDRSKGQEWRVPAGATIYARAVEWLESVESR